MNLKFLAPVVFLLSSTANASLITETTDVGETMATALTLPGGTTGVVGSIFNDVDLYRYTLGQSDLLTINVVRLRGNLDMNLLVFDSNGHGLAGNDDLNRNGGCAIGNDSLDSCLSLNLSAGDYFFAVGDNNTSALDDVGSILITNDSGILPSPTTRVLASFRDGGGDGNYQLNLSIPSAAAFVPNPATLPLLGLGLLGLIMRRTSRQSA